MSDSHSPLPALPGTVWPTFQPGWVWLAGAGPGDPGLLTLHALNALRQADVIVYDALVQNAILEWAPQAEHIYAGKRGGNRRQSNAIFHCILWNSHARANGCCA